MRRHQFRVGHGDYAHFPRGRQLQTGVNRRRSPLSPFASNPIVSRSKATTTTVIVVCIAISIIVVIVDNNNTDYLNVIPHISVIYRVLMFNYYIIAEISRGYGLICVEKTSIFENFLRKFLLRKK